MMNDWFTFLTIFMAGLAIGGAVWYGLRRASHTQSSKTQSGNPASGCGERYPWTPELGDVPTRNTLDPCPHCRARCPECNDEGMIRCQAFGCGGRGVIVHAKKVCTALPVDQKHPKDCLCGGTKRITTQSEPCPVCHGDRYATCAPCSGTTQVSSGRDNTARVLVGEAFLNRAEALQKGILALWQWQAAAPPCIECRGTGRMQETLNEQDIKNLEYVRKVVASQSRVRL